MSRNNEDRMSGGTSKPDTGSPALAASLAPLEFVRPTSIVALPSGGRFYPEGHPLHGQEEIEMRQMTTAEEDILMSRTLLKKGTAIDKFLAKLIDVHPSDLLLGDKNAILVQARIDGYGAEYVTNVQCPACTARIKHSFDLSDYQLFAGEDFSDVDGVTPTERQTFIISLDNGWEVEVCALNGHHEKAMSKASAARQKNGMPEASIQEQLRNMIVSISGHTDNSTINKAISHMTGKQSKHLREVYQRIIPNVDMKQEITCHECYNTSEMEVPLTADFFWPRQ